MIFSKQGARDMVFERGKDVSIVACNDSKIAGSIFESYQYFR
jgi:hypothetical protein